MKSLTSQVARRARQFRSTWQNEGITGIGSKARSAFAHAIAPTEVAMPVRTQDVLAADLSRPRWPVHSPRRADGPLTINWVTTPPDPSSGGHATLFRIIRYLQAQGCVNRVYFYDVYGGDHDYYAAVVRDAYGFAGPVGTVAAMSGADADTVVATAWPTAYAAFNAACAGKRYYFVQDFEPSFHPAGALSALAENTYRMGFHGITAGAWLSEKLRAEFGMPADHFEFGCDLSKYRHQAERRRGIAFYARPGAARRGFELGMMALEVFARRRPEVELHLYGDERIKLPFRSTQHGRVTPEQLNAIYNVCYAGLSVSLTNVSLVPHEMLAAGCIPVVNEAPQNRIVLDNPHVRYAALNPHALAAALEEVVACADFDALSLAAAASVRSASWDDAGAAVHRIFRQSLAV